MDTTDNTRLCAYIVPEVSYALDINGWFKISELKDFLSTHLPEYMIPSLFVWLDKMPLTPNGKVDRKALPDPVLKTDEDYVAPRNPIEEKLVEIWSSILQIERGIIGIDSDFFDLGGHSLRATLMISRIHKAFQVKLSLDLLFRTPVIRKLAAYIKQAVREDFIPIKPVEKKAFYRLSSAQKRLYILNEMEGLEITYNIPMTMRVEGQLDKNRFEKILQALINRHESLRTSFQMVGEEPVQRIHDDLEFEIEYHDAKSTAHWAKPNDREGHQVPVAIRCASTIKNFIRPFNLSHAPLFRVGLIRNGEQEHILMIDMHHIITDGKSRSVLIKEFTSLYAGEGLPLLRLQYKDYSKWQNSHEVQAVMKKQEAFWLKEFEEGIPILNMPVDFNRPAVQSFEGDTAAFRIGKKETKHLKEIASKEDATLFVVLLAIYNVLLSKLCNQEDIVVGTGAAGRNHDDLQDIIGMFVNTIALRNYPEKPSLCF
jgi:tyrocidine synthetase-3